MTDKNDPHGDVSTILSPKVVQDEAALRSFRVVVVTGPDAGSELIVDGTNVARALVGQSPACSLRLTNRQASRRHVALEPTTDGLRLTDLQSTNGTFVNGLRVVDAFLAGGETIAIGASTLRVEATGRAATVVASNAWHFGRVMGKSLEMRRLFPLCERIAASDVPVILEGETGTGKEVLAEAIHERSARASKPFIVFDCTAVPEALAESALFGHERGAFTGAVAQRRGVFELAHGGTLFIDEIGDLAPTLQPKLLRALERAEIQRVGAEKWTKVDVRVVAATRRDLDQEVQAGRFRDDLFFRLAVTRIELPALRQRRGDIAVLARHFWSELGKEDELIPPDFLARLEAYSWPGNVRELQNVIARRVALGDLAEDESDPPSSPTAGSDDGASVERWIVSMVDAGLALPRARQRAVDAVERHYVARVLERYDGNVARAAAASGIKRRFFQVLRARHRKPTD